MKIHRKVLEFPQRTAKITTMMCQHNNVCQMQAYLAEQNHMLHAQLMSSMHACIWLKFLKVYKMQMQLRIFILLKGSQNIKEVQN